MSTKHIPSVGSSGTPDGGIYAVSPAGHLVGTKIPLKDGWRAATQADIDAVKKAEADRQALEAKAAVKSGGPLAKGG